MMLYNFFQPAQYYNQKLYSVNQMYDDSYAFEIQSFLGNRSKISEKEAVKLQHRLIPFFNHLTPGFLPLTDKERYYILRAIAKIANPIEQNFILAYAAELSLGRLSYEIVDALCIVHPHEDRGKLVGFPNVNDFVDQEQAIQNAALPKQIYKAIRLVADREERIILARYFLVRDEPGKALLASEIKESMRATGKFTIVTGLGDDLVFHGEHKDNQKRIEDGTRPGW